MMGIVKYCRACGEELPRSDTEDEPTKQVCTACSKEYSIVVGNSDFLRYVHSIERGEL